MKNKKAFTLSEMLMVFVIIGLISAISLVTMKPYEKSYKNFYSRMHNSLSLALYNHMITTEDTDGAFPSTAAKFCSALLEYINTADGATNCAGDVSALGKITTAASDADKNFVKAKGGKDPNILVSNGAYIWIGSDGGKPFKVTETVDASTGLKHEVKYYIVYVDLNGNKAPNTTLWTTEKMADIVAFLVTDKYDIIPVGYPTVDNRYLVAHVTYPAANVDEEYNGNEDDIESDPITYYEAVRRAYGDKKVYNSLETYETLREAFKVSGSASPFYVNNYKMHYGGSLPAREDDCETDAHELICGIKVNDYY